MHPIGQSRSHIDTGIDKEKKNDEKQKNMNDNKWIEMKRNKMKLNN